MYYFWGLLSVFDEHVFCFESRWYLFSILLTQKLYHETASLGVNIYITFSIWHLHMEVQLFPMWTCFLYKLSRYLYSDVDLGVLLTSDDLSGFISSYPETVINYFIFFITRKLIWQRPQIVDRLQNHMMSIYDIQSWHHILKVNHANLKTSTSRIFVTNFLRNEKHRQLKKAIIFHTGIHTIIQYTFRQREEKTRKPPSLLIL